MTKSLSSPWQSVIALLLGAACALAFAPFNIFPFAIFSLSGLLALWLHASPRQAAWQGFLFGFGLFGVGVYWIYISIHFFGDIAPAIAYAITLGLIAILAGFIALNGYYLKRFFKTTPLVIFYAFPAMWVLFEWLRSWLLTGFPWLLLGYSQINTPLKGFAPLLSVYGVSLAVLYTSAFITHGLLQLRKQQYFLTYLNLFAIVTLWTGGGLLNLVHWTTPSTKTLKVAMVQGNIPQSIKWVEGQLQTSLDRYRDMSKSLWQYNQLIIWPEAAVPAVLQETSEFINAMDDQAQAAQASLITGIPILTADSQGYYNAVISVGRDRNLYTKRHLVPFGEYVPLLRISKPILNWLNIPIFATMPGPIQQKPFVINHIKIEPAVCYEITFPELMRVTDPDTGMLLTVTNDAWFGKSSAQSQHLQMAQMRAIELARPLLFVSNDGITAYITETGKIDASIPPYQTGVLQVKATAFYGKTPWMRYGMDVLLMFIFLQLALAAVQEKKNRNIHK